MTLKIDTTFTMYTDTPRKDPDAWSPTLRDYQQFLWSKPLPSGKNLILWLEKRRPIAYAIVPIWEIFVYLVIALFLLIPDGKWSQWLQS